MLNIYSLLIKYMVLMSETISLIIQFTILKPMEIKHKNMYSIVVQKQITWQVYTLLHCLRRYIVSTPTKTPYSLASWNEQIFNRDISKPWLELLFAFWLLCYILYGCMVICIRYRANKYNHNNPSKECFINYCEV